MVADMEKRKETRYKCYLKHKDIYDGRSKEKRSIKRIEFYHGKKCLLCGSTEDLQLHHINPEEKEDGDIWNWSEERRLKEIEKCDVLCHDCHKQIHRELGTYKGENNGKSKLTEKDVAKIKTRLANGESVNEIIKDFNVKKRQLYNIKNGTNWSWV